MAMANASKYGFVKAMRFNFGVVLGCLGVMTFCAIFTSLLYDFIPQIEPFMICIGAAYILWLAWTVWRDQPHDDSKRLMQTNSIVSGMVLQFINVKVILYGITGFSTFILPYYQGFFSLSPFVLLMSGIGFVSTCCWSLFGTIFEMFFSKHKKAMNLVLALLLVYCAAALLVELF